MAGRVNQLSVTDSGNYYRAAPIVTISAPDYDSSAFYQIDSSEFKFGQSSLYHDNTNASSNSLFTFLEDYGTDSNPHEIAFWLKPTSIGQSSLVFGNNFRIFTDSAGYVGVTATVDSTVRDSNSNNTNTRYNTVQPLTINQWNFIHVEVLRDQLRINVDSNSSPVYLYNLSTGNNFILDSGDTLMIGRDSSVSAPEPLSQTNNNLPNHNNSFVGYLDHLTFTRDQIATTYSNPQSERVPSYDSDYYFGRVPVFIEPFDYTNAQGISFIDSFGSVTHLQITDSGSGYSLPPTVTLTGNNTVDSAYPIGDNVEQVLANTIIRGEVTGYRMDSAGDSARYLYLAHVGADDGKYHEFVTDRYVINTTASNITGLLVKGTSEQNRLSENEQNEDFTSGSDNFLDFSEANPFGDPELN